SSWALVFGAYDGGELVRGRIKGERSVEVRYDDGVELPDEWPKVIVIGLHRHRTGPPNESRLSCGALKKNSFRNLRAPSASSACYAAGAPNLTPTGPVLHRGHAKPSRIPRTPP